MDSIPSSSASNGEPTDLINEFTNFLNEQIDSALCNVEQSVSKTSKNAYVTDTCAIIRKRLEQINQHILDTMHHKNNSHICRDSNRKVYLALCDVCVKWYGGNSPRELSKCPQSTCNKNFLDTSRPSNLPNSPKMNCGPHCRYKNLPPNIYYQYDPKFNAEAQSIPFINELNPFNSDLTRSGFSQSVVMSTADLNQISAKSNSFEKPPKRCFGNEPKSDFKKSIGLKRNSNGTFSRLNPRSTTDFTQLNTKFSDIDNYEKSERFPNDFNHYNTSKCNKLNDLNGDTLEKSTGLPSTNNLNAQSNDLNNFEELSQHFADDRKQFNAPISNDLNKSLGDLTLCNTLEISTLAPLDLRLPREQHYSTDLNKFYGSLNRKTSRSHFDLRSAVDFSQLNTGSNDEVPAKKFAGDFIQVVNDSDVQKLLEEIRSDISGTSIRSKNDLNHLNAKASESSDLNLPADNFTQLNTPKLPDFNDLKESFGDLSTSGSPTIKVDTPLINGLLNQTVYTPNSFIYQLNEILNSTQEDNHSIISDIDKSPSLSSETSYQNLFGDDFDNSNTLDDVGYINQFNNHHSEYQ